MATNNKLTIVVGAGASKEFGLPTGAELKSTIASLLNITFDTAGNRKSGDELICQALRLVYMSRQNGNRSIHPFMQSLHHICSAMSQAPSIDNFIDTHAGDKEIELCGKLAISRAILNAERKSNLYVNPSNSRNRLLFAETENTWLDSLLKIVTENCRPDDLEKRLSGLKFVVFNYDRCIEHFLYSWIHNYYKFKDSDLAAIINGIEIFHPYGTVGSLPWQPKSDVSINFGGDPDQSELVGIAKQINTFTEGTDPRSSDIAKIKNLIHTSEKLVFLGFAYHKLNLRLLGSPYKGGNINRHIFGTAVEISDHNCSLIKGELANTTSVPADNIRLRNDLFCQRLILDYSRSLYLH